MPFCKRLCWFCACRTQGTKTLKPVSDYLTDLIHEARSIADHVPAATPMARLHLGGGTPTLLSGKQMRRLLSALFAAFPQTPDFEFSVEIDPTDAAPDVLATLADWDMTRASIGVQDFDPKVQQAIGREQSFAQTETIVQALRAGGVRSLNIDLLYGLPHQSAESLTATLDQVVSLR
ncbi:MAG: radical SAM protein, partial [Bacteroidota bacterium]